MRYPIATAGLLVTLLVGTASADLQTDAFDAVRDDVTARDAALTGDLDKGQKKLKSAYAFALKKFGKVSTSSAQDAKFVKQIVKKLAKTHAEDAAMLALLGEGMDGFLGEMNGDLVRARRRVGVCGDENKKRTQAQKALDKAQPKVDDGLTEAITKKKANRLFTAEKKVRLATKLAGKAIDLEADLPAHSAAFLRDLPGGYQGAPSCIGCHPDAGTEMLASAHWNWSGVSTYIDGHESEVHGKTDLLNNFCIAIPSNEPRCTQCHPGYGWKDKNFDLTNAAAIDCLICHDTTGTYVKGKKTAGAPEPFVDLEAVAVAVGEPTRVNCGKCHYFAGGGDNVKHGDLASTLNATTRDKDVHMGLDGGDFACQKCHTTSDHKIAGQPVHHANEGRVECTDCHSATVHGNATLDGHTAKVACQTCHIPTFSREMPTKMAWYWQDAGQDVDPIPTDQYGKATYNKMKGTFEWGKSVRPVLRWSNDKWKRTIIGVNDTFTETPVVLAEPLGDKDDPNAKLYPFKKMVGNQPADAQDDRILVPHLFGMGPGPNPYWAKYDWNLALQEGAAYAGQPYSGQYKFVETVMYMSLNHEIAPKEDALSCTDCHNGGIDWQALGYGGDPSIK